MLRRRQINGRSGGRSLRLPAVVADLPFLLAEAPRRVADRLRPLADVLRWPFERAAWSVERRLLWPLRERFAATSLRHHRGGGAALVAVAAVALLAGVLLMPRGDGTSEPAPAPTQIAARAPATTPAPSEQPQGPVLKGAPPSFGVGDGVDVARSRDGAGSELNAGSIGGATAASGNSPATEEAVATRSSEKPAPAGPAAMKVARRFSEAFVFYEIGERQTQSKAVFAETATPELATALEERPPRLPANAKVPKARVLNLVPGPRLGKAYTVSVSLLRVGITSELRLSLQRGKDNEWNVAQVLG